MVLVPSWRHSGMNPVTGVLGWKDTGSLRRTSRGDKDMGTLSVTSQDTWCLVWDGWGDDWELLGEDEREGRDKQRCSRGLTQATRPGRPGRQRRWRYKQSRRILEYAEHNFFSKWQRSQRGDVLCWTLFLPMRRSWWQIQGFRTATIERWNSGSRAVRRAHCKLTILNFCRADFDLFKDLLGQVPWDKALEGRQAQESCSKITYSKILNCLCSQLQGLQYVV